MKSRPAGGMNFACRYSLITAAPNAEPHKKTTARMAMTFGLVHPASSRRSIRDVTSLLHRFRVRGKVHKHCVSLLGLVSDDRNVDDLLRDDRPRTKMAIFFFNANHPGPEHDSQG